MEVLCDGDVVPPPMYRQTDTCENSTFPILRMRAVNIPLRYSDIKKTEIRIRKQSFEGIIMTTREFVEDREPLLNHVQLSNPELLNTSNKFHGELKCYIT